MGRRTARTQDQRRDWAAFDRADRLGTTALLWLVVGASAGYGLFISLDWAVRRRVTLTSVPVDVSEDAAGVGRVIDASGDVLIDSVSLTHVLLLLLPQALGVGAAIWGAILLGRFLRDLGSAEPFTAANVRRLRVVALLLMIVPLLASLLYGIAQSTILSARGVEGFGFTFTFVPGWLVAGLLVAAVAQAFAVGTRLRADVDGLV